MKKTKLILIRILLVIFIGIAVFSAGNIALNFYQEKKSAKDFKEISSLVPSIEQPEKETTPRDIYADVIAKNSDFVGWIKIDGTSIDYPVVQSKERNYYLRRGFDKKYNYYGIPYAAEYCDMEGSDNVIIYGHNMNNGTMFADLEKYTSKSFYNDHKYIKLDTLDNFYTYEIIAVFKTVAYSDDEFKYYTFESGTAKEFDEYIKKCKSLALYETDVSTTYGDKLITLSTCEYSRNHGRLAIVAKRVEK